jgi:hypothetical protein
MALRQRARPPESCNPTTQHMLFFHTLDMRMTCPSAAATSISPISPKSTCIPRVPVKHGTCAAPSAPRRSRLHARTTCAARPAQRTSHTRSAPSLSPHANTCSRSAPAGPIIGSAHAAGPGDDAPFTNRPCTRDASYPKRSTGCPPAARVSRSSNCSSRCATCARASASVSTRGWKTDLEQQTRRRRVMHVVHGVRRPQRPHDLRPISPRAAPATA